MQPIRTAQPGETQPHDVQAPAADPSPRASRGGFTLTELLVVISIIAVLASLTIVGVMRALDSAKQTRIKTELDSLDLALKAYKEKYGSYPPCDLRAPLANNTALRQHIARAFPRYNIANLAGDLALAIDTTAFRPDQALVFWLQGFNPDPANPFVTPEGLAISGGVAGAQIKVAPLFDFDRSRLAVVPSSGATLLNQSYFPAGIKADASGAPYLYWDASTTTIVGSTTTSRFGTVVVTGANAAVTQPLTPVASLSRFNDSGGTVIFTNAGTAAPYWNDTVSPGTTEAAENFANFDSFQLIASGMDGKYGAATSALIRLYPTGTGYDLTKDLADDDNVTNFCNKARLGDMKP